MHKYQKKKRWFHVATRKAPLPQIDMVFVPSQGILSLLFCTMRKLFVDRCACGWCVKDVYRLLLQIGGGGCLV